MNTNAFANENHAFIYPAYFRTVYLRLSQQLKSPSQENLSPFKLPKYDFSSRMTSHLMHSTKVTDIRKQVRQQACMTQSPPYGLSRHRRPQFRLPTERRR